MRVAFVTNMCPHYRRPFFELLARRHEVDFYFFAVTGERYVNPQVGHDPGHLHEVPMRRIKLFGQPVTPSIWRRLIPDNYDVVVKCLNGRLMVPYTFAAAKWHRLPIVIWSGMWQHPQTIPHRITRPLTEAIYRHADALVVYGEHVKRFVTAVHGVNPAKVHVAGQAVDPTRFARTVRTLGDSPEFLYVGQLERRKGVDVLAAAIERIPADVRFVIAGNGSMESMLRKRLGSRAASVEWAGFIPQERLPDYLGRAWALVLPSITTRRDREPWGLVVNEAMHAGVPVIASDAVGAAAGGLVQDGINGRVVPEGDPGALAAAVKSLANNRNEVERMGAAAGAAVQRFSYESMAAAFDRAMEDAAGEYSLASSTAPPL